MKQFQGRVVTPGEVTAEADVTTQGFNTLASVQMALQFGDKEVKCGDQSNKEIYGKPLIGKALCLPQTIWVDGCKMPVVDCLGDEFLSYVKDGMKITVKENGVVEVE